MSEPLFRQIGGETAISLDSFALLLDIEPRILRAEWDMQMAIDPGSTFTLPTPWIERGRQQAQRVANIIGTLDGPAILAYLVAERDRTEGTG